MRGETIVPRVRCALVTENELEARTERGPLFGPVGRPTSVAAGRMIARRLRGVRAHAARGRERRAGGLGWTLDQRKECRCGGGYCVRRLSHGVKGPR